MGGYNNSTSAYDGNYSGAIKKSIASDIDWWLRSSRSDYTYAFFEVYYTGRWRSNNATNSYGVSPAFRIG